MGAIKKILIANRGEIACRIIRTCRRLGIGTVAVYSSADAGALHARLADEAYEIGEPESASSYLNQDKIVSVCKKAGADAVHPGYGFLSENASFVERLEREGIRFIGPSAKVVRQMGDKLQAKKLADEASVPTIPGMALKAGASEDKVLADVRRFVSEHGLPIMIKAAGGGGGRGMRKVYSEEALEDSIRSAEREARAFFSDGRLFVERLIENARHVEVQIFGDAHSNVVHLFDRDCTLQRNHQKVIEEAPAPGIASKVREEILAAAVRLGRRAGYRGAGTVEFLLAPDGAFFFLEVNSRLQVEHPVTEMITGLDLVELQIRAAEGADIQDELRRAGFRGEAGAAIECRICAEVPEASFAASTGVLEAFELKPVGYGEVSVRLDTGFEPGDRVTHFYDSMIAKLIVHAPSRARAIEAARGVLGSLRVAGVRTSTGYLTKLLSAPELAGLRHHVSFAETLTPTESELAESLELSACFAAVCRMAPEGDCKDPWRINSGWRLHGAPSPSHSAWLLGEREARASVRVLSPRSFEIGSRAARLDVSEWAPDGFEGLLAGRPVRVACLRAGARYWISSELGAFPLEEGEIHLKRRKEDASGAGSVVTSTLPGKVVDVRVAEGAPVAAGDVLLVIESMKMEHQIKAPLAGSVRRLAVSPGQVIEANAVLAELDTGGSE